MSQQQAIKTSASRGATYGAVAGFSQCELYFPSATQTQTNSSVQVVISANAQTEYGVSLTKNLLDSDINSPTFGQQIPVTLTYNAHGTVTISEKTDTTNYNSTPGISRQTIAVNAMPGAKSHKLFSYVGFSKVNAVRTVKYRRTVTVMTYYTGMIGDAQNPVLWYQQDYTTGDTGWVLQSDVLTTVPFSGKLSGTVEAFKNGSEVGRIPFAIYGAGVESSSSMIFDSGIYQAGIVLSRNSGGLLVKTPFDDTARSLPEINFAGEIDYLKIQCVLEYTVAPAGGMYFGVLSAN